jgi:serine/threonine-protein kinase
MTPAAERYRQIQELFHEVVDLPPDQRAAVLEERYGGDVALRKEVEALLAADEETTSFGEQPVFAIPEDLFPRESEAAVVGRRFGVYQVIREIGRGGLGAVYLAARADDEYRKEVAIKLIRRGLDTDDILRRFRTERQILAQLDHPNIARLIDGGTTDEGLPYFVMEYVKGEPITAYCDGHSLKLSERLDLFQKVCAAVTYAHQNLVVHRDLKPSNILVTEEGEPKLLDFGIAKLLTADDEMLTQTAPGLRAMTPDYASPEQIKGEKITTASDVYSLGLLLYELLTGRRPYRLATRSCDEIARAITAQEPVRPSTALTNIDNPSSSTLDPRSLRGDLDNIILMAMRKEPERRYGSVAQFSGDIRRHLEGLPLIAHKDTASYRASKFIRRHRLGVSAAALIILAIVTGLLVSVWQAGNARRQRDLAQRERLAAERLNFFLQRMLSFSNQSITSVWPVTQKRNVTVNEMLDQIVPQVDVELAGQPAVRAQVLRTIGNAYASQGQYDSAEKSLRAALDVQAQLPGGESTEATGAMAELGILLFRQAKLEEAHQLLDKAVALYRKQKQESLPGYSAAKFALALDYLGVVKFYRGGEMDVPRSLMREALAISSGANLQGSERRVVTFNKSDLGALLVVTGDSEQGEQLLREAAAEYRQMLPQPPWELGSTLRFLGIAALQKNLPDEAEKYLLEGEQVLRRTLGDQNSYLAQTLDRQAAALLLKNHLGPAEEKARAALAMFQAISPANKLPWAPALWTLGDILTKDERNSEGEDCYRQALAIHESQPKKNYLFLATSKMRLSQFLLAQKRFPEAERVALEARSAAVENFGSENAFTRRATDNLIQVYEALGKDDLAQSLK